MVRLFCNSVQIVFTNFVCDSGSLPSLSEIVHSITAVNKCTLQSA